MSQDTCSESHPRSNLPTTQVASNLLARLASGTHTGLANINIVKRNAHADGFSDFDEVEAEADPLSAQSVPADNGLNIILI